MASAMHHHQHHHATSAAQMVPEGAGGVPGGGMSPAVAAVAAPFASSSSSSGLSRPVPMKLFATWEVDRTPPNCIPRLCTLTLKRLVLSRPLGSDLGSVVIAVKMQSSKRTLRSNEIELPYSGLLDTELELTFSLQYPHFLKREGNQLHIMLQRRKKYKNRTILGFKTLAMGTINMSQVLQKQMDLELELFGDIKDKSSSSENKFGENKPLNASAAAAVAVGKVFMLSLSSQPVDHEEVSGRTKSGVGEVERDLIYSDDEEDFSSAEDMGGSDSEPTMLHETHPVQPARDSGQSGRRNRKSSRPEGGGDPRGAGGSGRKGGLASAASAAAAARQRNLKQKFVALLKKFKVNDPEDLTGEQVSLDQKLSEGSVDPAEIEDLFDQLDEDFSDSGPDVDTISIGSTPKPSLKPFFCSSKNLTHSATPAHHQLVPVPSSSGVAGEGPNVAFHPISDHGGGGGGSDRLSDDSSKDGNTAADSHPETLTDPEFSDNNVGAAAAAAATAHPMTSSPPQSGDELAIQQRQDKKEKQSERGRATRLFSSKEKRGGGGDQPGSGPAITVGSGLGSTTFGTGTSAAAERGATSTSGAMSASNRTSDSHHRLVNQGSHGIGVVSDSLSPRKVLLEQLSRVLPADGGDGIGSLPDKLILANTCDRQGAHLAAKLQSEVAVSATGGGPSASSTSPSASAGGGGYGSAVICTAGPADVRAALTCLVGKIQKFCHTQTQSPPSVRVALIGSDTFVNSVLRPYVEVFSSKPPDWQGYLKFFIIPLGVNTVSKHLGSVDPVYASLFLHDSWRELLEKAEPGKSDVSEIVSRISKYLECSTDSLVHLPVAEAMVTYKEKRSEETSQVFVPFVSDVRVGGDTTSKHSQQQQHSHDGEDEETRTSSSAHAALPSSTENTAVSVASDAPTEAACEEPASRLTPPSSPHVGKESSRNEFLSDPVDLTLDYWIAASATDAGGGANMGSSFDRPDRSAAQASFPGSSSETKKSSSTDVSKNVKTSIRYMLIQRSLASSGDLMSAHAQDPAHNTFIMQYWLKEKKPKTAVMRLGKKKDRHHDPTSSDARTHTVEGITRLICLSKAQTPLRVHIDGLEWRGVKYFQLSSQWQTHIKHFPIATFAESSSVALHHTTL